MDSLNKLIDLGRQLCNNQLSSDDLTVLNEKLISTAPAVAVHWFNKSMEFYGTFVSNIQERNSTEAKSNLQKMAGLMAIVVHYVEMRRAHPRNDNDLTEASEAQSYVNLGVLLVKTGNEALDNFEFANISNRTTIFSHARPAASQLVH